MKIGVTQIILGELTLDDSIALCQEAGYEALELVFGEGRDPDVDMSDDEIRGVRGRCDAAGIEISSSIGWYADRGSFLSPDPSEREKGRKSLVRSLEIANVLGVDAVLLHPGQLTAAGTYEEVWDTFLGEMKDMGGVAAEKQVSIGVENVWNKFLLSPREMGVFVDAVGSDWVGTYLDTANMMSYGFPEHWIRGLGSRIRRVHFKDFIRREHKFVPLMDGDTDWPAVVADLRSIGYDHPVIHEVGGDHEMQIEMAKRMKKIVAL
ncbi:MAG: sugar phosphate isomerase/epimerase family protein [Candidatus Latescibacteria bacterium]|nr:sugar phosphate isomerase/epimerase family protein [Candidatus Latescibacterota bacterium]